MPVKREKMHVKEMRPRRDEIGTDSRPRSTNKKAITATSISARCPFMRDNIAATETLFKYWDTPAWHGLLKFPQTLFLSRSREKKRNFLAISRLRA